ncbi:MAG: Thymidylate synthase, flavin-dependent [Candidatus Giovannonibacteria bacterium GW2011_GWB1_47_6b]|uniref:Thymidylate synthase, flavin-dependent n=1 Tax=Candidatus Giovannonibacteria bacterium GW2011_GWB1_47_6b TaxID=1618655 RepID=A0A0G1T5A5_9BACT|nr:MAG: Thymidylate synthase, flavin-dependent [Candidatus Giovannonibacteria bacterium GW2011_GWB1_47_6b]
MLEGSPGGMTRHTTWALETRTCLPPVCRQAEVGIPSGGTIDLLLDLDVVCAKRVKISAGGKRMKILKSHFVIEDNIDGERILKNLERYGRTCYKSEDRITAGSARKFIAAILKSGHESVIEHEKVTVRIICDRGVTHEIVRHRVASYSQESTRYCNYRSRGIQVIEPFFFVGNEQKYQIWLNAMSACENSLKTEIVITYNLREWRHFFRLRCSKRAHPQMREIAVPLLKEFQQQIPVIFDDITTEG